MFVATLLAICFPVQQLGGLGSGDLRSKPVKDQPTVVCALKGTRVRANIAGLGAAVTVTQTFTNPSRSTIEAIYTFPLPHDAAIDRMRMKVGSQIIEGRINKRDLARRIYEAAKNAGQTAALLDQERPNIFTQSVANITPGAEVQVEISYVQILKYEKGEFEFSYPMVVGPRFLGNAKDPQQIDPPRVAPGTRSGNDIDLKVAIESAAPIKRLSSALHDVNTDASGERMLVTLANKREIPNRDFILTYESASNTVSSSFVTSFDKQLGGFFSLILLPPKAPKSNQIAPREVVFVMDQSGSQSGLPLTKSKELTLKMMGTLRPGDTFNVFGFNNTVQSVFDRPLPANGETLKKATAFVNAMNANGGTQLLEGLNSALKFPKDPRRLRIVLFNTDGYVGDEPEILDSIQKNRNSTRIFTFGIGNSVNRFLVESMSREGRGACEVVTLNSRADESVKRFMERAYSPILTDIAVSMNGATELTPSAIPDVFNDRPIVVFGRYAKPGTTTVNVSGRLGGEPWTQSLPVTLGEAPGSRAVSSLWARNKIEDLQSQSYVSMVHGKPEDPIVNAITDVALEHGIMSQYTSFVAVSPRVVNVGGRQRTVYVPVERADGLTVEQGGNVFAPVTMGVAASKSMTMAGGFAGGAGAAGGLYRGGRPGSNYEGLDKRWELTPALQSEYRFDKKVASALRLSKGRVEVMVWVTSLEPAILKSLKEMGLTVDESLKDLRVVIGTCDAASLRKLADLSSVVAIEPIE